MWHKFSIRTQLLILLSSLLLAMTSISMGLSYWLDKNQRQTVAIELATTLTNALSQDMLEALLSNQTDGYADLSFKLTQFNAVDLAILYNDEFFPVFKIDKSNGKHQILIDKANEVPQFNGSDLFIKLPIKVDGVKFGEALYVIDTTGLSTQLNQQILWLGVAIPLELLIGLILATGISRRYSQPIETIAQAMKNSNPTEVKPEAISTLFQNEIKTVYSGFNKMMDQIYNATAQLRHQSEHDQLTGAYNRFYIEQKIKKALKSDSAVSHSLFSLDLNQFKIINDSAGITAGDELLKMVVRNCEMQLSENMTFARMEGNTFFVLIENTTPEKALSLAQKQLAQLNDFRFTWEGQAYSISACIGIVHFKPNEHTLTQLIQAVDNALNYAKADGRNRIHVYQSGEEFVSIYNHDVKMATLIKQALNKDGPARFELFAQAIVPLQTQTDKIGYEILLRMKDKNGKIVAPDHFLPTAERYQLMADIDQFVLWQYLTLVSQKPEHINKLRSVHVNLSGSSLNHPDFQSTLEKAITHFDFPWNKLELELTETAAVGNFNQANQFIERIKSIGIGLALDDFGTGMSSFEYLKSLPFDIVKIDGSFVKDMHEDPSDKAVIRYIHEISSLRNQETVAEYVETKEDVEELTRIGITYGQGYYLGKPKPLGEWLV